MTQPHYIQIYIRRDGILRLHRLESGRFLPTCHPFYAIMTIAQLLMVARKTFGQTRSGTGNTHALGQNFPRSRTLVDILYCCPQARLRTLPVPLGNRGDKGCAVEMGCQERRVQVTLDRPDAACTLMPPL